MTEVVNIRLDKYDIYCGRAGHGENGYFGNPFFRGTREEKIAKFRQYFYERIKSDLEYKKKVRELRGKRLGCFCKQTNNNIACHCDIYKEWLDRPLKVIIAGGRTIIDEKVIVETINDSHFNILECVCGMAKGVDSVGREICKKRGINIKEFYADWNNLDKSPCRVKTDKTGRHYNAMAGFNRNLEMAEYADALICIHRGSPGSLHMIQTAKYCDLEIFERKLPEA